VVREILFRKEMILSVLTERRVFAPYGLHGGQPGKVGSNILLSAGGGPKVNLGGKNSTVVKPGDIFRLLTPGGGGYGYESPTESNDDSADKKETNQNQKVVVNRGSLYDYKRRQEAQ